MKSGVWTHSRVACAIFLVEEGITVPVQTDAEDAQERGRLSVIASHQIQLSTCEEVSMNDTDTYGVMHAIASYTLPKVHLSESA